MARRRERIEQMLVKEPADAFLNFSLAMEQVKGGEMEAALAQFDRVLAVDPKYLAAYFQKGNALIAAHRTDEARAVFRAGIQTARSVGDAHAAEEMQGVLDGLGS